MGSLMMFDDEFASVEVVPAAQLVRLTWKGNAAGAAYRGPSNKVLSAVQEFGLKYFLSDARRMGPILYEDRAWSEREIIPKLVEAGLKRIAIVSSNDGLNLIAVDNMVNTIPMGTATVAFFDDPARAETWLLTEDAVDTSVPSDRKGA